MEWETPTATEIEMNAEIGAYQQEDDAPVVEVESRD